MTWTPPAPDPCGPDCTCRTDAHPTGNAAQSIGDHDRRQREIDTELDQLRPCTCATSDTPGQHHCGPSAQLPPRREDTERARDWTAYQTGRVPTERVHDGKSGPLPPVPEQSHPPEARDLPVHTDRPSIVRRILNATRKAIS